MIYGHMEGCVNSNVKTDSISPIRSMLSMSVVTLLVNGYRQMTYQIAQVSMIFALINTHYTHTFFNIIFPLLKKLYIYIIWCYEKSVD